MARKATGKERISAGGEEDKAVVGRRMSALDVFGGLPRVFSEITRVIRDRIHGREDIAELERYSGLEEGILRGIVDGKRNADKAIFLALKAPLNLSLGEALGKPEQLNDAKAAPEVLEYWNNQWNTRPMKVVAFAGGSAKARLSENPIDLESYVALRAIGEFYRLR